MRQIRTRTKKTRVLWEYLNEFKKGLAKKCYVWTYKTDELPSNILSQKYVWEGVYEIEYMYQALDSYIDLWIQTDSVKTK